MFRFIHRRSQRRFHQGTHVKTTNVAEDGAKRKTETLSNIIADAEQGGPESSAINLQRVGRSSSRNTTWKTSADHASRSRTPFAAALAATTVASHVKRSNGK